MNSRILVSAVAVLMLLAGAAAYISLPNDAAGSGDGSDESNAIELGRIIVNKDSNESKSVLMKYNKSAYAVYGSDVTSKVEVKESDGNPNDVGNAGATLNGLTFTKDDHDEGLVLKVSGSDTATSTEVIVILTITVSPFGATPVVLDSLYYKVTVDVRETGNLDLSVNNFTVGKNMKNEVTVTVDNGAFDASDYTWYATGLPAGLNIYSDDTGLFVAGMAVTSTTPIEVKVIARDIDGNEYSGTLSITVSDNNEKITYVLKADGTKIDPVTSTGAFIVQKSTELTLDIAGVDSSDIVVSVIDTTSASRTTLAAGSTSNSYEIPSGGVGSYIIEINGPGGITEITLMVVPGVTGAGAGVVIVGSD